MDKTSTHLLRRRDWLRLAAGGAGLAALGGAGTLLGARSAQASDYRALVCIYLFGGNDGFNVLVPTDSARHEQYRSARGVLALPKSALLPLGRSAYGLHPAMESLLPAWSARRLAPIINVGPLAAPLTKAQYLAEPDDSPLIPPSLFSHSDQQRAWESASTDPMARTGWGARTCELLGTGSPVISVGGTSRFGTGDGAMALALPGPGGGFAAMGLRPDEVVYPANQKRQLAVDALYAEGQGRDLAEAFARMQREAFDTSGRLEALVVGKPGDGTVPAAIDRAFAGLIDGDTLSTPLAAQLYQIAKLIAGRRQLQGDRHIYFASLTGFDTHAAQVLAGDATQGVHAGLVRQLADALAAFDNAMQGLGMGRQVTAFTHSDFGRTLVPNQSGGSDHGWGNIQLVMGGSVQGGATYGRYPELVPGGPDDVGVAEWERHGRWIPTSSVDQFAATLLEWFGASDSQIDNILPNLKAFGRDRSLGFMA